MSAPNASRRALRSGMTLCVRPFMTSPSTKAYSLVVSLRARSTKSLALRRGRKEVDKQLVDAFSRVVMHPVRRVGQSLHTIEVGHIVALGLGEVGAEVGIALPPD